jgi:nicotinate-nucleotide adenylyltransferase
MKIGLYFGTFNPIHVGHLVIANYFANNTELDQIWLVVTPHNPLKKKSTLLTDFHRLMLVKEAIDNNPRLVASDIEFRLKKPNYTIHTLAHLSEVYPEHEFSLILGEDNLRTLHKWFNYELILEHYKLYVYPRPFNQQEEYPKDNNYHFFSHPNVLICKDVPMMNISSTYIRDAIKTGRDVQYLLTEPVHKYVQEMNFYKK